MKKWLFVLLSLFPLCASAFPVAPFDALNEEHPLPESLFFAPYDFEGIVKLSNCSGALVRYAGQPDSAKALVLTNGHCVKSYGFLQPGEVWVNRPSQRRMKVANSERNFISIQATKVLFATMTTTDAALYELKESFQELESKGIRALYIDSNRPQLGQEIEIISGYWERGYACHIDGFVFELRESSWSFFDSIRYSPQGCEVIGGTSGSPILEKHSRSIIGVNNTGNQDGSRCQMNNPCEVDREGRVTVQKGINYGQQTYLFYECLTVDFKLDLNIPGCQLPQ
ncbi:MAG: trypsin-like peptidase domain-containing protein [Bdellovibrionales bacterium]|nr:trypsin-like peptidase domain-containing protein [Bdellovibrionales bacterium]